MQIKKKNKVGAVMLYLTVLGLIVVFTFFFVYLSNNGGLSKTNYVGQVTVDLLRTQDILNWKLKNIERGFVISSENALGKTIMNSGHNPTSSCGEYLIYPYYYKDSKTCYPVFKKSFVYYLNEEFNNKKINYDYKPITSLGYAQSEFLTVVLDSKLGIEYDFKVSNNLDVTGKPKSYLTVPITSYNDKYPAFYKKNNPSYSNTYGFMALSPYLSTSLNFNLDDFGVIIKKTDDVISACKNAFDKTKCIIDELDKYSDQDRDFSFNCDNAISDFDSYVICFKNAKNQKVPVLVGLNVKYVDPVIKYALELK